MVNFLSPCPPPQQDVAT